MKTLTILTSILLFSSCAFHSGTITSNVTNEPVVHKDLAVGTASTNIVLNIGGLSKDALISEARKNMVRARPLEGAEQYNNVELNIKNTFYIVGHKTKVTIKADVIAPKDSVNQASYSEEYLKKITNSSPTTNLFSVGDSVIFLNYDSQVSKIVKFPVNGSQNLAEISYLDKNDEVQSQVVSTKRIYIIKDEHFGLKKGQRYKDGIIVGFGLKRVLTKTYLGYFKVPYPK